MKIVGIFALFITRGICFAGVANAQQAQHCVGSSCFPMQGGPSEYSWGTYYGHPNDAIDINFIAGDDSGKEVYSIWAGNVILSGQGTDGCGTTVIVDHPTQNTQTLYCHLKPGSTKVRVGQSISAGQLLALANNSGTKTSGAHLHLQVGRTSGGSVIGYYTEQQTVSIPALAGMRLTSGQQADNGTTGPGSAASQLFLLSGAGEVPEASNIPLNLEIDWPRLPGVGLSLNELVEGKRTIYLQNIVNFIFVFALWTSAMVAFISIVYAGFIYIVSGANPGERSRSIQGIKNVAAGIAILLCSVIILNMLNPNLTNLNLSLSLDENATRLLSPNAPTASGGLRQNTVDHAYAPIPFTDRTGTEDTYAALIVRSSAVEACFAKAPKNSRQETECKDMYEREVSNNFKSQGAIIVQDDDDTAVSCAAVCMQVTNDSLNCRQFGSGQDNDSGGAKMIWNTIRNSNGTQKWAPGSDGSYGKENSPSDKWLRDDSATPGDEDLLSRQCLAKYVVNAIDSPGNFSWDACYCNSSPSQ